MSAPRFAPLAAHVMRFACAALLLAVGSCRESPMAPAAPISSETPAPAGPQVGEIRVPGDDVPQFRGFEIDQVGHDLHIRFSVDHRANPIHYDPLRPDGWSFQLFLDTDQSPTGYWLGYDYLTRDSELDLDGKLIRVRRTIPLIGPGADGWGEETAVVPIHVNRSTLTFRVPLEVVTDHDGKVDFALEIYRTSACAECPNGRTFDFAYVMFGTSDPHGRSVHVRFAEPGERGGHYARTPGTVAAR